MQRRSLSSRYPICTLRSLAVAGLGVGWIGAGDAAYGQVLDLLDGHWQGGGIELSIDARRAQARHDRQLPFQWEAFNVRNVEGGMVVFTIGTQLFIGQLSGDELSLTSPGTEQPTVLNRSGRLAR